MVSEKNPKSRHSKDKCAQLSYRSIPPKKSVRRRHVQGNFTNTDASSKLSYNCSSKIDSKEKKNCLCFATSRHWQAALHSKHGRMRTFHQLQNVRELRTCGTYTFCTWSSGLCLTYWKQSQTFYAKCSSFNSIPTTKLRHQRWRRGYYEGHSELWKLMLRLPAVCPTLPKAAH